MRFFAGHLTSAHPQSEQAKVALRLTYHTSALAAISLDFILADKAFQSHDDRRAALIGSIRFGHPEGADGLPLISAALGLTRKYAQNGAAVAKQIEYGFYREAERIPAEIIADYITQISTSDALFNVACEIERAANSVELPSYDEISKEAKSLVGVFLDFNGISREKIAAAWPMRKSSTIQANPSDTTAAAGPLFANNRQTSTHAEQGGKEVDKT
jgi:hypothetical protein